MIDRRARRIWTPERPNPLVPTKTSWFQPSNETMREQARLLAHSYFLVKQGDTFGERLKCTSCGLRHDYITMRCVNKPITGLAGGLFAYYRLITDLHLETELKPEQLVRFREIRSALNEMPDLSRTHPQMARQMMKDIGPSDMKLGALSLGILEPISPTEAADLVDKINERGVIPRYKLHAVGPAEFARMSEYRQSRREGRW